MRSFSNRYWRTRLLRHASLGLVAVGLGAMIYALLPPPDIRHRISFASAYAAIAYLGVSLGLGPYRVWRKLPNPVSFDLRRDVGIWAGLLAVLHTVVGLTVHLRGRMWMYFLNTLHPLRVQASLFGVANYVGAGATFVFLVLLAISNDLSLRKLGTARWKSIQRWAYVAAVLSAVHGFAYQVIEKRDTAWVLVLASSLLLATCAQAAGIWRVRENKQTRRRS